MIRRGLLVVAGLVAASAGLAAQGAQTQPVEVSPVECWWRTSTPSVRVGETFAVHLTCSALETEAATAVIDRSQLGTASLQLPPFEVISGSQSADHVTAGRRYFQYQYNVRLIADDAFGSDVVIPVLPISYRIESRVQQDGSVVGREQTYDLPALVMRINSLVSGGAGHIREAPVPTLDEIAAREFRARMFRLVALILFAVAGLMLLMALLRWFRQTRKTDMAAARHFLPARTVLAAVRRELQDVERQARGAGWSQEAVARALAATRVAASYAQGAAVAQRESSDLRSGELALRGTLFNRPIAVSGAATSHLLRGNAETGDLRDALATFTAARYGRLDTYDGSALDDALASANRGTSRVARDHSRIAEMTRAAQQGVRTRMPRAWAR